MIKSKASSSKVISKTSPKPEPPPPPKPNAQQQYASFLASCIKFLSQCGESGKYIWLNSQNKPPAERVEYLKESIRLMRLRMIDRGKFREFPVDIVTFIESTFLLNMEDEVWPKNKALIKECAHGEYIEGVFTGGIGTGKTTCALVLIAYALYELACMINPQAAFGIAKSSEILFVFQSLKKELSKAVDYERFKAMIDNSPYFDELFRYDHGITSELRFPFRIIVRPLSGDAGAAIGQNVFGGVIDEVNFMAVIEGSKMAGADGGTYDQAKAIYSSIVRRRESRFLKGGRLPGMLCLVSSKRYPGEFTDVKIAQAKAQIAEKGSTNIFVYDKRAWEVKPEGSYTGEWFRIFLGDHSRKPRMIKEEEFRGMSKADKLLCMLIPLELKPAFDEDILDAIRDVAGVSTLALHPFIMEPEKLALTFGMVPSILSRIDCDFMDTRVKLYPRRIRHRDFPRFVHIDIGLTRDSLGMACGYCTGFKMVQRGTEMEVLPKIVFDFTLEVRPPRGGEIELENIRTLLYGLREGGVPVKWVTMDSFQSKDTLQILARKGFVVGEQSVDLKTTPYEVAKQALYDERVMAPEDDHAKTEWVRLERNTQTQKIDHPEKGSKDVSDAMAGVIYGLTMRREIWRMFDIPMTQLPMSLTTAIQQGSPKNSLSYMENMKEQRYAGQVLV